jgi:hypothetical protein
MTRGAERDRAGRPGHAALTLASMSRLRAGQRTAAILAILLLLAVAGSDLLIRIVSEIPKLGLDHAAAALLALASI